MEHFVIIVNGFQPLAITMKRSILDVAAALYPPLQNTIEFIKSHAAKGILNPVLNYPWSSHDFSILVKTGQINNTQSESTTHHVMYRVIYLETFVNVIKWY